MHDEILVTGVMEITNPKWLSPSGYRHLEKLVRQRDNQGRLPGVPLSELTLEQLYDTLNSSELSTWPKIRIEFLKGSPVFHPTAEEDPKGCVHFKSK